MHYRVGTYPVITCSHFKQLRNYPLSTTSMGGQITLELYLFGSREKAQTPNLRHLPSRFNFKRSRRDDRSYLLHRPCTNTRRHGLDVVLVKQQSPISPITVLENHLHVNHALLHTTLRVVISFTGRNLLRRCYSTWQQLVTHV